MDCYAFIVAAVMTAAQVPARHAMRANEPDYLPSDTASKVVNVTRSAAGAATGMTILTEAVAIKETGPKKTVARFGEVYAFAPSFLAVHRDEPTAISSGTCKKMTRTTSCWSIPTSTCS